MLSPLPPLVSGVSLSTIEVIYLGVFTAFFIGTAVTIRYRKYPELRSAYLACFFTALLVTSLVGMNLIPFTNLHKYTDAREGTTTYHEMQVVDEHGNELRYDPRASPHVHDRLSQIATQLADGVENEDEVAHYLLQNARAYRDTIRDERPVQRQVAFPPPSLTYKWSPGQVADYGEFTGLRVYHVTQHHTDDGTDVTRREKTLEYEYVADVS